MKRTYLMFQLHGPLQSWGSPAAGIVRMTERHPTKSAVLGLVAACKGIRRDQEDALVDLHALNYACRVDAPGHLLMDYQTIAVEQQSKRGKTLKTHTIESYRWYLTDAVFTACLRGDAKELKRIQTALDAPIYTPYLGRKACPPSLPFAPALVSAADLREALGQYQVDATVERFVTQDTLQVFWEGSDTGIEVESEAWPMDQLVSRSSWAFCRRREYQGFIPREEVHGVSQ